MQWETGPGPDTDALPDPPDPPDPLPDGCDPTKLTAWRVDILFDPNPTPGVNDPALGASILEVKNWKVGTARAEVREQLDCYLGVKAPRTSALLKWTGNGQLNNLRWSRAYPDNVGNMWCVWADRGIPNDPVIPGAVFFAPQADPTIPEDVRDDTPGCDAETEKEAERTYDELFAAGAIGLVIIEAIVLKVQGIILARQIQKFLAEESQKPQFDRPVYTAGPSGEATYQVTAPKSAGDTTLEVCYGDGACEQRAIPGGSGSRTFIFSHTFSDIGTYVQTASIVETEAAAVPAETIQLEADDMGQMLEEKRKYAEGLLTANWVAYAMALADREKYDPDMCATTRRGPTTVDISRRSSGVDGGSC